MPLTDNQVEFLVSIMEWNNPLASSLNAILAKNNVNLRPLLNEIRRDFDTDLRLIEIIDILEVIRDDSVDEADFFAKLEAEIRLRTWNT